MMIPNPMFVCDDPDLSQLTKKNKTDAGLDIQSSEDYLIPAGESAIISTNLYMAIPEGCVGIVKSRSGLSVKNNVEVGAGVIDSSYRGEIKVHLYNHGLNEFRIKKGDRIAQILTIPVILDNYIKVDSLDETERGDKGFGSSGV